MGCAKHLPVRSEPMRVVLLALALTVVACGPTKYPLTSNSHAPAAGGVVKVSSGDNNNSRITVEVHPLAPADKVHSGATTYVVWVAAPGAAPQNVGALTLDGDLNGTLETVTPLKDFAVFVTPESAPAIASPTGPRVLEAAVR